MENWKRYEMADDELERKVYVKMKIKAFVWIYQSVL